MTKLLGYPASQLIGKELFQIGLLRDETASREMFQRLKRNREVRYQDLPLQSKGGLHQDVEVVANVYEENGRSVIQCNIRDITDRKRSEDALRRNEALFSALLTQAPVGVYVVDARLRLQQVNPKARPVFANVHPLIGRDFAEIIRLLWPHRVAEEVLGRFRHTLATGVPFETSDFVERRKDIGAKEYYEWQIQRVTLPAGEHGVVCFFNNITERKQTEEVRRRLDVLTASNKKLEAEIVRRRTTEVALAQSERHQFQLLKKSDRMQEQLRNLSHKILRAQEEERKRISRELHDIVAQTLVGIHLHLTALTEKGIRNPQNLQERVARTQELLEESVETMHRFARELRPKMLDDLGLIPALHAYLEEFTKRTGVLSRLTAFAATEKASLATRTVLYRVAQEALSNVANHAQASHVHVYIEKRTDSVQMSITDDGRSFDVAQALRPQGMGRLGLLGMRERLEMVGGSFDVKSTVGVGTVITAQIPLSKAVRLRINETHWRSPEQEASPEPMEKKQKTASIPRRELAAKKAVRRSRSRPVLEG
jgi:PAS domain S-box-containing protein